MYPEFADKSDDELKASAQFGSLLIGLILQTGDGDVNGALDYLDKHAHELASRGDEESNKLIHEFIGQVVAILNAPVPTEDSALLN